MANRLDARGSTLSVEGFRALPDQEGFRLELVRGAVVREPAPGPRHGQVAFALLDLLRQFGVDEGLGLIFFDTGFVLATDPATVRVPDVAFVSLGQVPAEGLTDRFWHLAPDLVIEVVSPSNSASEIQAKALDFLDAGTRVVWVADPGTRRVTTYRSRAQIRVLEGEDRLDAPEVLPGLSVPVDRIFG